MTLRTARKVYAALALAATSAALDQPHRLPRRQTIRRANLRMSRARQLHTRHRHALNRSLCVVGSTSGTPDAGCIVTRVLDSDRAEVVLLPSREHTIRRRTSDGWTRHPNPERVLRLLERR